MVWLLPLCSQQDRQGTRSPRRVALAYTLFVTAPRSSHSLRATFTSRRPLRTESTGAAKTLAGLLLTLRDTPGRLQQTPSRAGLAFSATRLQRISRRVPPFRGSRHVPVTVRLRNATSTAGCLLTHNGCCSQTRHDTQSRARSLDEHALRSLWPFPLDVAATFPLGKSHIRLNPAPSRDFELNTRCSAMYSCPPGKR